MDEIWKNQKATRPHPKGSKRSLRKGNHLILRKSRLVTYDWPDAIISGVHFLNRTPKTRPDFVADGSTAFNLPEYLCRSMALPSGVKGAVTHFGWFTTHLHLPEIRRVVVIFVWEKAEDYIGIASVLNERTKGVNLKGPYLWWLDNKDLKHDRLSFNYCSIFAVNLYHQWYNAGFSVRFGDSFDYRN